MKYAKKPSTSTTTPSTPTVSIEVNEIQSSQPPDNKKKGKRKNKKPGNQQESNKTSTPENDASPKWKAKYPFLLCGDDHFTKECPRREEINNFLKNNPTPGVLTEPFLSQQ